MEKKDTTLETIYDQRLLLDQLKLENIHILYCKEQLAVQERTRSIEQLLNDKTKTINQIRKVMPEMDQILNIGPGFALDPKCQASLKESIHLIQQLLSVGLQRDHLHRMLEEVNA